MNVKEIRRKNLRALSRKVGGVTQLAERLSKLQSQISHLIGTNPIKNIGDKLATQVEKAFNLPHGWLDHLHPDLQEESAIYSIGSPQPLFYRIPLVTWQEAADAHPKYSFKNNKNFIVTQIQVSPNAFALQVEGDSMESTQGISFPNHSIIIVDPEYRITNNAYVIAKQNHSTQLVFKQYATDGNRRYLKPLNPRYPLIEINTHAIICGVIRGLLMEFK